MPFGFSRIIRRTSTLLPARAYFPDASVAYFTGGRPCTYKYIYKIQADCKAFFQTIRKKDQTMNLKEDLKAGDEITIQIAPFGEYPAETVGGIQLVEVFDRDGFEKISET